jgi:hypothetical protein
MVGGETDPQHLAFNNMDSICLARIYDHSKVLGYDALAEKSFNRLKQRVTTFAFPGKTSSTAIQVVYELVPDLRKVIIQAFADNAGNFEWHLRYLYEVYEKDPSSHDAVAKAFVTRLVHRVGVTHELTMWGVNQLEGFGVLIASAIQEELKRLAKLQPKPVKGRAVFPNLKYSKSTSTKPGSPKSTCPNSGHRTPSPKRCFSCEKPGHIAKWCKATDGIGKRKAVSPANDDKKGKGKAGGSSAVMAL